MDTTMIIFSGFFALVILLVIVFFYLPIFIRRFKKRATINMKVDDFHTVLQGFWTASNENGAVGKDFVKLIHCGYIQCPKMGNHGRDFPDEKQYRNFMKYATPEIAAALKEIGDSI